MQEKWGAGKADGCIVTVKGTEQEMFQAPCCAPNATPKNNHDDGDDPGHEQLGSAALGNLSQRTSSKDRFTLLKQKRRGYIMVSCRLRQKAIKTRLS